jgi:hypothetical protein
MQGIADVLGLDSTSNLVEESLRGAEEAFGSAYRAQVMHALQLPLFVLFTLIWQMHAQHWLHHDWLFPMRTAC